MDIAEIDKNFKQAPCSKQDVEWFKATDTVFSLHGVFYDETEGAYRRMTRAEGAKVSYAVSVLSGCTAGGRVRFVTDSPYVAIKCVELYMKPASNGSNTNNYGFSVFENGKFRRHVVNDDTRGENVVDKKTAFSGVAELLDQTGMKEICIHFPAYCDEVYEVYIGVKAGSTIQAHKPYRYQTPVVYYGSSITQGGCASHAGNDYPSFLTRWLDTEFLNLGFSGSAKGEPAIAEYLAKLDASVFVIDYDFNAPDAEHLRKTHYPLYETVRKAHPDTPIIFISKPNFDYDPPQNDERRAVIKSTYLRAKKNGDKRVWFIDGEKLFGKCERSACTVDATHPNDLGMYRMAKTIYPVLKKALKIAYK